MSYLEDIGGKHSNIAGYGIFDIPSTHLTWLLLEWKLQVIRRPNYAEKIKVTTWSKNSVKCYAYRDFKIYDEQGNVIVLAASKWVLVDTEKSRIVKIEPDLLAKYEPELDKSAFDGEDFEKIHVPKEYQNETEYIVRKSDIDVNNHMNNLCYLDIATEILPDSLCCSHECNEFEILYKKQIKLSENNIIAYYGTDNDANYVVVKSTDGSILHSIMKFW